MSLEKEVENEVKRLVVLLVAQKIEDKLDLLLEHQLETTMLRISHDFDNKVRALVREEIPAAVGQAIAALLRKNL